VFVLVFAGIMLIPATALAHHVMPYPEENSANWEFIDSVAHGASVDNSAEMGDNVSMGTAPGTISANGTMEGAGSENMVLAGDIDIVTTLSGGKVQHGRPAGDMPYEGEGDRTGGMWGNPDANFGK
jgi:hypothetical protein